MSIRFAYLLLLLFPGGIRTACAQTGLTADSFTTAEDTPLTRTAAQGIIANDPAGLVKDSVAGMASAPLHGTVTLALDGSFTWNPAVNWNGTDSFTYRLLEARPDTTFTIDEPNSTLTVGGTLRIDFQGVPSISTDSATSNVAGSVIAGVGPSTAPFSVVQIRDANFTLTDVIGLKFGVGCIPIINTCLGGVKFDSQANAIKLSMENPANDSGVRSNGIFDQDGALFSVAGEGTITGTEELATVLPAMPMPLNFPALPMPFNGRITTSGGRVRLEMQINYRNTIALDASTSFSFNISGVIRATAPLPLAPVKMTEVATVSLTVTPVNDAPVAASDRYLVRAGTALTVTTTGAQTTENIVNANSLWKYNHTGTDLGTTWRSWSYNDAAWASGAAELGYGDSGILGGNRPEATNIRGSTARPTAYFRRAFTVTDVNSTRSLSLELLRDDGAAVYLNGIAVARQNLAVGATYTALAESRIPNADETRFFPATLPPSLLLEGRNVLAVEVHQFSTTDFFSINQVDPADVSFDLKLKREKGLTGALANDSDIDSPAMTITLRTPPAHGTVDLQPDGAFTYTPASGFTGTDSFLYRLSDGGTEDAELRLIPMGATWKYLDDGSDKGTAWRDPAFNDSAWPSGAAEIGYGDDNTLDDRPETTKLSYFLTNPPVTTYFRKSFALPLPKAMLKSLRLRLLRDDGAAVFLNGTEIARDNLPAGATSADGATLPIEGLSEEQFVEVTLDAARLALLNDGANVLAVELHQNLLVSNDASFDCELIATAEPGGRVTFDVTADDFDQDQVADAWERAHGLDFAVPNGDGDPDGDGRSNRMEFLADTNPRDAASHLRITAARQSEAGMEFTVPAVGTRQFILQSSSDLSTWVDEGQPLTPSGGMAVFTAASPGPVTKFYRVRTAYSWP